jgi:hypothetical protein
LWDKDTCPALIYFQPKKVIHDAEVRHLKYILHFSFEFCQQLYVASYYKMYTILKIL